MLKFIFIVLLIFLFSGSKIFAQDKQTDSLINLLKTADDTTKINIYTKLSARNYKNYPDKGLAYGNNAYKLAVKYQKNEKLPAIYNVIGRSYMRLNKFDSARLFFQHQLEISIKLQNEESVGLSYLNLGNTDYLAEQYQNAINNYQKSLNISEKIKDYRSSASTLNNIGNIYWKLDQYDMALNYFEKTLFVGKQHQFNDIIAPVTNNIGTIYWKQKKYDKAIEFFNLSYDLRIKMNDKKSTFGILNNIGLVYKDMENYDLAIDYFNKSLVISRDLKNEHEIANTLLNIALTYITQKKFDLSLPYITEAMQICERNKFNDLEYHAYSHLAEYYEYKKDYKNALINYKKYQLLSDSIYKQTTTTQIAELQTRYETEKQNRLIESQNNQLLVQDKELTGQRMKLYLSITVGFLLFVFLIIIIPLYNQKRKTNTQLKLQNAEILHQKEEILAQSEQMEIINKELENKNEKIIKQNENTRASLRYAQTIQQAVLPLKDTVDKYFKNFIVYLPKDIVSGDFYWFSDKYANSEPSTFFLAVADCTGHGVPGAFMSLIGTRMLSELINEREIKKPAEVLTELDLSIKNVLQQHATENNDGMDIGLCKIEKINNEFNITFAGAKQNLFFKTGDNEEIQIAKAVRRTIGGFKTTINNEIFTDQQIILKPGDAFYMVTDGLFDQNDAERKRFGSSHFIQLMNSVSKLSINAQKDAVLAELKNHQQNTDQRDDITIIGLKLV